MENERYAKAERARKTSMDSPCRFEYRRRLGTSGKRRGAGELGSVGEAVVGRGVYGDEGEDRFRNAIVPGWRER